MPHTWYVGFALPLLCCCCCCCCGDIRCLHPRLPITVSLILIPALAAALYIRRHHPAPYVRNTRFTPAVVWMEVGGKMWTPPCCCRRSRGQGPDSASLFTLSILLLEISLMPIVMCVLARLLTLSGSTMVSGFDQWILSRHAASRIFGSRALPRIVSHLSPSLPLS